MLADHSTHSAERLFEVREHCISCGSEHLRSLSSGTFGEEPLRSYMAAEPNNGDPLSVLAQEKWDFRECAACGQKQHYYVPSPALQQLCFSEWQTEETIRAFEAAEGMLNPAHEHVQHVLRLKKLGVKRVLDFGCGFAKFLQMCRLFDIEAVGIDRSQGRRSGAGIEIHSDLAEVTGTFDAITMFEVLEHIYDPMPTVLALKTKLNRGGVMIVETPDASDVTTIDSLRSYRIIHPLEHVNGFTQKSLIDFMSRAGFTPMRKQPAFCTMSLVRLAKDLAKATLRRPGTQLYFKLA